MFFQMYSHLNNQILSYTMDLSNKEHHYNGFYKLIALSRLNFGVLIVAVVDNHDLS